MSYRHSIIRFTVPAPGNERMKKILAMNGVYTMWCVAMDVDLGFPTASNVQHINEQTAHDTLNTNAYTKYQQPYDSN